MPSYPHHVVAIHPNPHSRGRLFRQQHRDDEWTGHHIRAYTIHQLCHFHRDGGFCSFSLPADVHSTGEDDVPGRIFAHVCLQLYLRQDGQHFFAGALQSADGLSADGADDG